jgi:hypothetical protein
MKSPVRTLAIAVAMFCAAGAFAQTAAPAAKASAPAVMAPAAKATPAAPATPAAKAAKTVAPGGGNGKVWVNTTSKVYHCEGSKDYGTTKAGEYMTEADAKAKGFHGVKGKVCAK